MTQQGGPAPSKQPTTVEIPPPPAWAIEMATRLQDGIAAIRADVSLVSNDVTLIKDRVTLVESRTAALEGRADSNSIRAKSQSEIDATQSAQLAQERGAREELTTKVDGLVTLNQQQLALLTEARDAATKLWANPVVKALAAIVWTAIIAYLAKKGISIQ